MPSAAPPPTRSVARRPTPAPRGAARRRRGSSPLARGPEGSPRGGSGPFRGGRAASPARPRTAVPRSRRCWPAPEEAAPGRLEPVPSGLQMNDPWQRGRADLRAVHLDGRALHRDAHLDRGELTSRVREGPRRPRALRLRERAVRLQQRGERVRRGAHLPLRGQAQAQAQRRRVVRPERERGAVAPLGVGEPPLEPRPIPVAHLRFGGLRHRWDGRRGERTAALARARGPGRAGAPLHAEEAASKDLEPASLRRHSGRANTRRPTSRDPTAMFSARRPNRQSGTGVTPAIAAATLA